MNFERIEQFLGFDTYKFDKNRRLLLQAAGTAGILTAAGIALENLSESTPSAMALASCPTLETDGRPPLCTEVGQDQNLLALSKFSRYYFIDRNGNNEYDYSDRDVMGVPNGRLLIESFTPIGSGDFVQPDFSSRRITNNAVEYFDHKNGIWRPVGSAMVLEVPRDGGNGLALDRSGKAVQEWRLRPGNTVDKIWGPVDSRAKRKKENDTCAPGIECDWNCVQWVLISRLMANADITRAPLHLLPNEVIHRLDGKISSITDYIYYWDLNKVSPITDHSFINSPVVEGSELWKKEGLVYKDVDRPEFISSYR